MFSLRLTRWLLGYVQFTVIGGSMERFLNQCARAGIYLWDIRCGPACSARVPAGKYRLLHCCARRACCRLKVKKKAGLPFATMGLRHRQGLIAGAALFAAVIWVLSLHLWCVEVRGNRTIPTAEIEAELSAMGVAPGALKNAVDPHVLQQTLMLKFPQISWLSVNTRGCAAEIELEEGTSPPKPETKDTRPCNIKAAATGQIIEMTVYTGTPHVKKGDAVVEGQLLISGVVEEESGLSVLKHAAGNIMAETRRTMTAEVALSRTEVRPTGRVVSQRLLNFFGARVPLTLSARPNGTFRAEGRYTRLRLMNAVLPVSVYEEKWIEEKAVPVKLTQRQAVDEAKKIIEKKQKETLGGAKILSCEGTEKAEGSRLIYTALVKCEENIAKESEILIK
ncbi:MAG: sporulation protein YqfD [Clostridiales bacterium]|nr:sporulation protein YqfD [Clostridiales bacterium]